MRNAEGGVEMNDSIRAESKQDYVYNRDQLKKIVDLYKERKYCEDLDYIEKDLGGIPEMLAGLKTSVEMGISSNSLQGRNRVFGTHKKEPPERTGFCTMLLEALDDFMLKILIGCAIFQLIIEMSTAEPEDLSHAWIEGFAILLAVAVVSLVGAGSDFKKEGQFLKQQLIAEATKNVSYFKSFCSVISINFSSFMF